MSTLPAPSRVSFLLAPRRASRAAGLVLLAAAMPAQKFESTHGNVGSPVAEIGMTVVQTPKGYAVAGTAGTKAVAISVDSVDVKLGDASYTPLIGDPRLEPNMVRRTAKGWYVSVGELPGNTGGHEVYIGLFDKDGISVLGSRLWTYRGDATGIRQGVRVTEKAGGGFAVTTNIDTHTGASRGVLFSTDAVGIVQWWHAYTYNRFPILFHDVRQATNGDFVVVGSMQEPTRPWRTTLLLRTTSLGVPLCAALYGDLEDVEQQAITTTKDGNFVIWGHYGAGMVPGSFLLKVNNACMPVWRTYFPGIQGSRPTIAEAANGDLLCNGRMGNDALILRANSAGVKQFARAYGGGGAIVDEIFQVISTSDNGFAATGLTNMTGGGLSDVYLLKGDAQLRSNCNDREVAVEQAFVPTPWLPKVLQYEADRQQRYVYFRSEAPATSPNEFCFEPDCVKAPKNLTAWLTFDDLVGPTAVNRIQTWNGQAWHGAHAGNPTPIAGKVSGALNFDGADDRVIVPHHGGINVKTGDFTIDAWIRVPATLANGIHTIVDKRVDEWTQPTGYSFFLYKTAAGIRLGVQVADGTHDNYVSPVLPVAAGQWHFVAVRVDRDASSHFLFDDSFHVFTPGHPGTLANTAPMTVGGSSFGGSAFQGDIDELEVFRRALDPTELRTLWRASYAGKCKESLGPPPYLTFAQGASAVQASGWITNGTTLPQTYTGWLQGLESGSGGTIHGPTQFLPADPITIGPIAPGATQAFSTTVQRPQGMTDQNLAGGYRFVAQSTSGDVLGGESVVIDRRDIQVTGGGWDGTPTLLRVGVPLQLGPARVTNTTAAPMSLAYRVIARNEDHDPDTSMLSLDGLAPGSTPSGSVVLQPGAWFDLAVTAEFVDHDALGTYTVQIEADTDNDGEPDFLGGRVLLCDMRDLTLPTYTGVGAPTTVGLPTLSTDGPALVGGTMAIVAQGLKPDSITVFALSAALANPPLPLWIIGGQPGAMLYVDAGSMLTMIVMADPAGVATVTVPIPADQNLAGAVLHWQVFDRDPALPYAFAFGNSNAMSVTIE
ncbi:MAG: LamG domain-containing protein [Planctomycetota bacterium]